MPHFARRLGTHEADATINPSGPPLPAHASVSKRWKFRRNLVIYVAYRNGLSQRLLSDVFDLPRSRVGAIIQEFKKFDKSQDTPGVPAGTGAGLLLYAKVGQNSAEDARS